MFRCQVTGKVSQPGEKSHKVVTKTRPKTYTNRVMRGDKEVVITSQGWEIVQELVVCEEVYNRIVNESIGK